MQLCTRCNAAVEAGRSHCPICDQAVSRPPDATWVQGGPPTPATGTPAPPAPPGYGGATGTPAPPAPPGYGGAAVPAYPVVPAYGVVAPVAVPMAPPRSKAAALLCFFFGYLGVHRFYTGQVGLGVALLLTTLIAAPLTCGLSLVVTFVWVLVDFVLILTGGVNDQWGRPLV